MFRNYLKIAFRHLHRNRSFSAINIAGLAIGMTACMLLLLYIRSETSFDKHHRYAKDLYLVNSEAMTSTGAREEYPMLSAPYAGALASAFPEVLQTARLYAMEGKTLMQLRESGKAVRSFYETSGYQVDPSFFELFTYHFTEGNATLALRDPNSIVLSEQAAQKLFGNGPALNRTISVGGSGAAAGTFRVTGVFRDESSRSHIDARFFVPLASGWMKDFLRSPQNFSSNNVFYTYLRLRENANAGMLEQQLPRFMKKYAGKDLKAAGFSKRIFLLPVTGLHLYKQLRTVVTPTSSAAYLYILGSIALFILLIACINFMNLSTARSANRASEVGIRKVMGAKKAELMRQFLGESMLLTVFALVISAGLVALALPLFNQLTSKTLTLSALLSPGIISAFIALALLTGLIAGSYPAFYLSVFNPVEVLKGRLARSLSGTALRRGLVVFQFVISVGLVLATLVIREQMKFLRDTPLGFTKDQQIVVPLRSGEAQHAYATLRREMLQNSQVKGAAGAVYYPGIQNPTSFSLYRPDQTVNDMQGVHTNWVAPDFLQTMGFQLLRGRLFSEKFRSDTNSRMVVNETTLKKFAIPLEKAIGQHLNFDWQGTTHSFEIVGVVKDFHFEDLHQPIQPYAFMLEPKDRFNYTIVHVNTTDIGNVLAFMGKKWKALLPDEPFEYTFLNEDFQRNYHAEERTSRIVSYFTLISIFISCLGLFGLAAFAAQQRTREIGIRKVLGASVTNIMALLSKDFIKPVLLSIIIASPLTWFAMSKWLEDFAYRTHISWWVFPAAGLLAISIALLTVGFQAIKAALANPVKSLTAE